MTAADANCAFEGPTFKRIIQDGEWRIFVCWGVTWFSGIITLLLWLRYSRSMKSLDDKHDPLRRWFVQIVFLGQVWALTTGLSVAFVRGYFLFSFLQKTYEALTICALRDVVIELAGRKEQLIRMMEGKRGTFYSAFPFLFLKYCMKETEYNRMHIAWSWRLTRQAYVVIPGIALFEIFILIMEPTVKHGLLTLLSLIQLISVIIAVYGVLLVLQPVRKMPQMEVHRIGWKFLIIKGAVLLGVVQGFIIQVLVDLGVMHNDSVLSANTYIAEVLWTSMLLAIEAPIFIYYTARYYPLEEVTAFYEEIDATITAAVLELHRQGSMNSGNPEMLKLERTASSFARDRLALSAGKAQSVDDADGGSSPLRARSGV